MVAIKSVATTGVIVLELFGAILARQIIICTVVEPLEGEHRALVIAFVRVVKNNIENHLNSGPVQGLHHVPELLNMEARLWICAVALMGSKISHRAVTPVVY